MLTSPLLFAAGTFWATLGSLKTRHNASRRKLPRDEHAEGGSCLYHVRSLHAARTWLACDAAICYLWWWIAQALSPVRSRWRRPSARWRWDLKVGCQVRASGWRRPASDEWGGGCGRRQSPQCLVDGQSVVGARAKPLVLEGRQSSVRGCRERKEGKAD